MRTRIIKMGNSQGIRIPKALLEQSGLNGEVELKVQNREIIIRPPQKTRQGWAEAFRKMAEHKDDQLLDKEALHHQSSWDKENWSW